MRKQQHSRSGRLHSRIFAAVCLCLIGAWLAMLSFAASSSSFSSSAGNFSRGEPVVPSEFRGDVRNLPQVITEAQRKAFIRPLELDYPRPAIKQVLPGASLGPQTLTQSTAAIAPSAPMPSPATSFAGMNYNVNGAGHPPDTVGDVGPNHFVQAVNTSVGIYDKTTGSALAT